MPSLVSVALSMASGISSILEDPILGKPPRQPPIRRSSILFGGLNASENYFGGAAPSS
jgi:hypothetical protein